MALARALVQQPRLLLLDEPFGALDALTRIKMQSLVKELVAKHQPGVFLVTHDVDEAIVLADRAMVMRDGAIACEYPVSPAARAHRSHPTRSPCAIGCWPNSASAKARWLPDRQPHQHGA